VSKVLTFVLNWGPAVGAGQARLQGARDAPGPWGRVLERRKVIVTEAIVTGGGCEKAKAALTDSRNR